jgi:uncharacterized protein (TIGR04222 family)
VTPSDAVDQVWHLHLTYTCSYWQDFCPDVLGCPLQHGPTRGGAQEARRFERDYDQTLASYERIFGEPAPADIWPPVARRFGRDLQLVRVERGDYWMLRKPRAVAESFQRAPSPSRRSSLFLLLLLLGFVAAGVLVWFASARQYLAFAGGLTAASAAIAWKVRAGKQNVPQTGARSTSLDAASLGYLSGGRKRLLEVALTELVAQNAVSFDTQRQRFSRVGSTSPTASPLARRVREHISASSSMADLLALDGAVVHSADQRLQRLGLLRSRSWLPACLVGAAPLLGCLRLCLGLVRQQPVGYVVLLSLIGVGLAIWFRPRHGALTPEGRALLRARVEEAELPLASEPPASTALISETPALRLATQVALFGPGILLGTDLAPLAALRSGNTPADPATLSSNSGTAACGGSCSGASGCSGAGCGGGCGGCGGCGG